MLRFLVVLLFGLVVADSADAVDTIRGRVLQVTGDLSPRSAEDDVVSIGAGDKATATPAENVAVYAIPAELIQPDFILQSTALGLISHANASAITDKHGRYSLAVSPGRSYRILVMIGPATHRAVSRTPVAPQGMASVPDITIDRTTH